MFAHVKLMIIKNRIISISLCCHFRWGNCIFKKLITLTLIIIIQYISIDISYFLRDIFSISNKSTIPVGILIFKSTQLFLISVRILENKILNIQSGRSINKSKSIKFKYLFVKMHKHHMKFLLIAS